MAATPLMTFMGAGYYIIALFLLMGIIGIIRAVRDRMSENCDSKIDDQNTVWSSKKSHQDIERITDMERVFGQSDDKHCDKDISKAVAASRSMTDSEI